LLAGLVACQALATPVDRLFELVQFPTAVYWRHGLD